MGYCHDDQDTSLKNNIDPIFWKAVYYTVKKKILK